MKDDDGTAVADRENVNIMGESTSTGFSWMILCEVGDCEVGMDRLLPLGWC